MYLCTHFIFNLNLLFNLMAGVQKRIGTYLRGGGDEAWGEWKFHRAGRSKSKSKFDQIPFGNLVKSFSSGGEDILGCQSSPGTDFEADHLDGCGDEEQVNTF